MILQSALYPTHDPFILFESVEVINHPNEIKEGACLLLHGGADISPSLYNHKVSKHCHASAYPSSRDSVEKEMILMAAKHNNPIIGICRGAQLLCAVDGGHLVQHIIGHGKSGHTVHSRIYGNMGESNTAHHQMMIPRTSRENTLIGYTDEIILGYEQEDKLREYTHCPEVIHFSAFNAIGIQGHPEWMNIGEKYMQNLRKVIQDYLLKD